MLSRRRRWRRDGAAGDAGILAIESYEPEDGGTFDRLGLRRQIPGGASVDVTRTAALPRVAAGEAPPVLDDPEHRENIELDVAAFTARRRGS